MTERFFKDVCVHLVSQLGARRYKTLVYMCVESHGEKIDKKLMDPNVGHESEWIFSFG